MTELETRLMDALAALSAQWDADQQQHAEEQDMLSARIDDLAGKPDLVFAPRRKVVFVHGCFWHGHACKRGDRIPKTNRDYWTRKIARNKERDQDHVVIRRSQPIRDDRSVTLVSSVESLQ